MGLFLEIKISLDLVPSLTPIRNYRGEYRTAVTYNLPPPHFANSHSLCYKDVMTHGALIQALVMQPDALWA